MTRNMLLTLLSLLSSAHAVNSYAQSDLQSCASSMDGKLPAFVPSDFTYSGTVRRYYIAAEEVEWNFGPTGWDNWLGVPLNVSPRAESLLTYNSTYLKALYRGYTDCTFTNMTEHPSYQGTQGPTIRAEVGDMIEIMFVNKLSKAYATLHSMGLQYSKMSEGGDYPTNSTNNTLNTANAVPPVESGVTPGGCAVYKWLVPASTGPTGDVPAKAHSYHSYVDLLVDTNSGLIGPTIIYGSGKMNSTMAQYREIPLLYMGYNEAMSVLSGENSKALLMNHTAGMSSFGSTNQTFGSGNSSVWHPQIVNLGLSGRFSGAPQFFTLNGYFFANNPTFEMCLGDKVIWYAYAYGAEPHVFHLHGHSVQYHGSNEYSISLGVGEGKALYMNATVPGLWQVICHVNDHHQMGMVGNYRIYNGDCPLSPLEKA